MEKQLPTKRKRGQHGPTRHGGFSYLTKGEAGIPKNRQYIRTYLQSVRDGVIRDLGGEANMKATQVVMLDRMITALGICRLVEEHVKEKGIINTPAGFLHPSLSKGYIAYSNQVRMACQMLDAAPKAEPALLTPHELLIEVARDAQASQGAPGSAQDGQTPAGPSDCPMNLNAGQEE